MKAQIESWIRRGAWRLGLDITRLRPHRDPVGALALTLSKQGIDLVLDVGANTGQFASGLRRAGYDGWILSIEPLREAHAMLAENAMKDGRWVVPEAMAISSHPAELEMNVAANSVSSSLLPMLDAHLDAEPSSAYLGKERVNATTLDHLRKTFPEHRKSFLKLDIQGHERAALQGAQVLLNELSGVQMEVSLTPLYDGGTTLSDADETLRSHGFSLWSIWPGFVDSRSGRMLQADVTYLRIPQEVAASGEVA